MPAVSRPGRHGCGGAPENLLTLVNSQRTDRTEGAGGAAGPGAALERPGVPFRGPVLRWDGNGSSALIAPSPPQSVPAGPDTRLRLIEPPVLLDRLAEGDYQKAIETYERRLIEAGLAHCGGRIKPTSRLLGISRTTLKARIEKYGLSAVA